MQKLNSPVGHQQQKSDNPKVHVYAVKNCFCVVIVLNR